MYPTGGVGMESSQESQSGSMGGRTEFRSNAFGVNPESEDLIATRIEAILSHFPSFLFFFT